ncbi:phosphatase PAP2 family protein [Melioribacteraceae bacterium 4301-Me]|uniref:phosphatase PAP2 family protein n=1 Tax=Pyranulibacter aquaticus TaxID=3163344 RepID=UPI0035971177
MYMLKEDLINTYNDAKSYFEQLIKFVKINSLLALSLLVCYLISFFVDSTVRLWFSQIHSSVFDTIFSVGHFYGKLYLTIAAVVIFYGGGIVFNKEKIRLIGLKIFEAFFISGIIVTVLKSIFGRWRPYSGHGSFSFVPFTLGPNDHLSLPSGDVAVAFAFSAVMASLFNNILWKIFWYGLAVLTFFGRIYHDQHWLTDAVMAAVIATSVGLHISRQKIPATMNNEQIKKIIKGKQYVGT